MKAYKVEILVIDFDEVGGEEIKEVLENTRYPNHCIDPHVMSIVEKDIGEWDDEHPFNLSHTMHEEYARLFGITSSQ